MGRILAIYEGKNVWSQDFGYGDHYPCRGCRRSRPHYDFVSFVNDSFIDLKEFCGDCTISAEIAAGVHDDIIEKFPEDSVYCFNKFYRLSVRCRASAEAVNAKGKRLLGCNINSHHLLHRFKHQKLLCFYTNASIEFGNGLRGISTDRIDSSMGYIQGNVALTTWEANRAKSDSSLKDFLALCRAVATKYPG